MNSHEEVTGIHNNDGEDWRDFSPGTAGVPGDDLVLPPRTVSAHFSDSTAMPSALEQSMGMASLAGGGARGGGIVPLGPVGDFRTNAGIGSGRGLLIKRILRRVSYATDRGVAFDRAAAVASGMTEIEAGFFELVASGSSGAGPLPDRRRRVWDVVGTPKEEEWGFLGDWHKTRVDERGIRYTIVYDQRWWGYEVWYNKAATKELVSGLKAEVDAIAIGTSGSAAASAYSAAGTATAATVAKKTALGVIASIIAAANIKLLIKKIEEAEQCNGVTVNMNWAGVWWVDSGNTT